MGASRPWNPTVTQLSLEQFCDHRIWSCMAHRSWCRASWVCLDSKSYVGRQATGYSKFFSSEWKYSSPSVNILTISSNWTQPSLQPWSCVLNFNSFFDVFQIKASWQRPTNSRMHRLPKRFSARLLVMGRVLGVFILRLEELGTWGSVPRWRLWPWQAGLRRKLFWYITWLRRPWGVKQKPKNLKI